jgi:hypothetical protein
MAQQQERSSRPRAMIHDAQEHAYQWHDMAMRAHQNVAEMSEEGIRRMYFTAVMNYWKQLERFSGSSHVRDIWNENIAEGWDMSLEKLREVRFKSETTQGGDLNPNTGQMTQARKRPWSLEIEQSTRPAGSRGKCPAVRRPSQRGTPTIWLCQGRRRRRPSWRGGAGRCGLKNGASIQTANSRSCVATDIGKAET